MLKKDELILVDEDDYELGFASKLEIHQKGLLHRAFSILIFNSKGEFLIHQRTEKKYHSPNLWTNTCCSHPNKGETTEKAAHRRLKEEMGFDCNLNFAYKFIYKTDQATVGFENNLIEHELDYVYLGEYNQDPHPNPDEILDFKWISLSDLRNDILKSPEKYTFWFKLIIQDHLKSFYFPNKRNPII